MKTYLRWSILLFVCAIVLVWAFFYDAIVQSAWKDRAESRFRDGTELFEQQQYDLAILAFTDSMSLYDKLLTGNSVKFRYELRRVWAGEHFTIGTMMKGQDLKLAHDAALRNRGHCYLRKGEFENAIADFTRAMEWQFSPKFEALLGRAKAYRAIGEEAKALRDEQDARNLREGELQDKNTQ